MHIKKSTQDGFLLLEVLLALLLLSITILPWYSFLRATKKINPTVYLNDFFKTKKIFIEQLHNNSTSLGEKTFNHPTFIIKVKRTNLDKNIAKLTVNLYRNKQLQHSLVGVYPKRIK